MTKVKFYDERKKLACCSGTPRLSIVEIAVRHIV